MIYISFIVPVYNVGKEKLKRCLDSIYDCGLDKSLFEVIVVNDDSPKWHSEELDVIGNYPGLIYTSHQMNKKLGAARNTGLKHAKGVYVWFVDSDDSIVKDSGLNLSPHLIDMPDLIQFGSYYLDPQGKMGEFYFTSYKTYIGPGYKFINNHRFVPACSWSKLINRDFLLNNYISHPEGVYYEDQEFLINCLINAYSVKIIPDKFYIYSVGGDSIMTSKPDLKHTQDRYKCVMECKKLLREISMEHKAERLSNYQDILIDTHKMYLQLSLKDRIVFNLYKLKFIV